MNGCVFGWAELQFDTTVKWTEPRKLASSLFARIAFWYRFSTPSQSTLPIFASTTANFTNFCASPRKQAHRNAVLPDAASLATSALTLVNSLDRLGASFWYFT